jgi:hypothetical protein
VTGVMMPLVVPALPSTMLFAGERGVALFDWFIA